ncbi:MAG: hypothetical protein ACK4K5_01400 [Thermosynechococcus sp.]|uniref:hypothetical protein n=1 Tax=Thermosynechococcus sp. TaxID=2814275 RepID=UPI0039190F66
MLRWRERWSRFLWSISGRLLLVILLISLLPMGMVVLYNQAESAEMMKRLEIDALQLLAIGKARSLDRLFQDDWLFAGYATEFAATPCALSPAVSWL